MKHTVPEPTEHQRAKATELVECLMPNGQFRPWLKRDYSPQLHEAADLVQAVLGNKHGWQKCTPCIRKLAGDLQLVAYGYRKYSI